MKIRNSSRITAIVLALVMLLPLISVPTFAADYDAEDILWSEDFSSYEGLGDGVYAAKNNTHFYNSGGPKNMEAVTVDANTYLRFPMEIMLGGGGTFDGLDLAVMVSGKYEYWHVKYPTLVADPSTYNAETNELTFVSTDPEADNVTVTLDSEPQGAGDFIYYGNFTYTDGVKYRVATPNFAYVSWIGDGNVVDKYAQLYFGERETYTAEDTEVLNGLKNVGDLKAEPAGYSYEDYDKIVLTYKAMIESNSHGILNMQLNHFANSSNPTSFNQNFVETGNLDLSTGTWSGGCFAGVTFPKDEWFDLYFVIDLDNATIEGIYNGKSRGTVNCGTKGTGGIVVNSWTVSKIWKNAYYDGIDGAWCIDDVKVLDGAVADNLAKFTNYSNDFESQNIGDGIGGFVSAHSSSKVAADPTGAANKVWKLVDSRLNGGLNNNNSQKVNSEMYKASYGDKVTLTTDYYIPSGTATQLQTQFHSITGKTAGAEATQNWGDIFVIRSTTEGALTIGREGNPGMVALNYDEWFTVAVEFTMSTNTYDVYINKNLAFGGQKIRAFDSLTVFPAQSLFVAKENTAAKDWVSGPTYIDNITLKTGTYDGAFKTGDSWNEDELYAAAVAWDLDNAEVASAGVFSQSDSYSFPNSLIFVDSDEDMTPDGFTLEISDADGNLDMMVRPNHVGLASGKVATAILSADYVLSEDAEGIVEIQLHTTSPMAWGHLAQIDATNGTVEGYAITKGEKFNITMVMTFATGAVQIYCNNVLVKTISDVNMVKDGLSVAEWSVAKVMKDCESYAGTITVTDMSIATVLVGKSANGLYLYDQLEMVTLDGADVNTMDAASVRLYAPTGLRFATQVSDDFLAVASKNMKIGTLIAPADYITEAGGVFTKEALEALPYVNSYIDVVAQVGDYYTGDGIVDDLGAGTYFTASIVNIKEANIGREFAAIGYIEYFDGVDTVTIYSDNYHTASVQEIAAAALESGNYDAFEHILSAYVAGEVAPY